MDKRKKKNQSHSEDNSILDMHCKGHIKKREGGEEKEEEEVN